MYKILLVDDDIQSLKNQSCVIMELGFKCLTAKNGREAINCVLQKHPDAVLANVKIPNQNDFEVLKATLEFDPNIPVVFFTGNGSIESAIKAIKLGAYDYIQKPVSLDMLKAILKKAIEYRESKNKVISPQKESKELFLLNYSIGKSTIMKNIAEKVHKIAKNDDVSVFIYGESGTGKELIARSIHEYSQRCKKSFIALDCVALPSSLLQSEIFGFEHGAFTGAHKSKPGVMELADGGTLFLDEIVELAPYLQAKLLRVLQERQFRRIGGTKLINVNLRIISATNKNPEKALKEKKLRQDLFYRLNVVPIFMPPLRDRKEDIPLMVRQFIKKFNPSCHREIKGISEDAMKCLQRYDWPGNVRELQNIIKQAMSLTDQDTICLGDLPENIRENHICFLEESFPSMNFKEAREKYVQQFSKQYFNSLLKKYNGNISEVARKAGVSRRTIYRIIQNYNNK